MPEPTERDAIAKASYDHAAALAAYEEALASRDSTKRAAAEARLHQTSRRLSAAQSALVAARSTIPRVLTFEDLLNDPTQQFDPASVVLRSILAYRNATAATASADPPRRQDDTA